jgi:hypothetical protein
VYGDGHATERICAALGVAPEAAPLRGVA